MDFIFDPSLVLYLPLYQLDGSSFTSKDAYGHLCTATGAALYPGRGRYFDGTDDTMQLSSAVIDSAESGDHTVLIWANRTGDIARDAANKNGGFWQHLRDTGGCQLRTDISGYVNYEPAVSAPVGEINLLGWIWNTQTQTISFNINGSHQGDINIGENAVGSPNPLNLGSRLGSTNFLKGIMGEAWIYSRVLTHLEIQHIYLQTKWRWQ